MDAAVADAGGSLEHAADANTVDAGVSEAGLGDAGQLDAGVRDAGLPDAGRPDAGVRAVGLADAGRLDAGTGAGLADARRTDAGRPGGDAAFLFFPDAPSVADGTILPPASYEGPGAALLKYAAQQQLNREKELAAGQRNLAAVSAALAHFFKTSGGENPRVQRDELARLAATALEQSRLAYLAAADHERRRLAWVVKAVNEAEANEEPNPLPGANLELLTARQAAVRDGRVRAAIDARIKGYRGLMMGIVAWVDGDTFLSLEQLKQGAANAPDLPLAHLYLGYVQYILEDVNAALAAWRRALDLDPTNDTIKKLIADHLHERK